MQSVYSNGVVHCIVLRRVLKNETRKKERIRCYIFTRFRLEDGCKFKRCLIRVFCFTRHIHVLIDGFKLQIWKMDTVLKRGACRSVFLSDELTFQCVNKVTGEKKNPCIFIRRSRCDLCGRTAERLLQDDLEPAKIL